MVLDRLLENLGGGSNEAFLLQYRSNQEVIRMVNLQMKIRRSRYWRVSGGLRHRNISRQASREMLEIGGFRNCDNARSNTVGNMLREVG